MFVWASRTKAGAICLSYRGGWRFHHYERRPLSVSGFDWSTVRRGRPVVLSIAPKLSRNDRRQYHEREPGVFDAIYAGHDRDSRPRFASTVDKATRLARVPSLFAFADDEHAVELFVDYLRRRRASLDLMRRVVAID